MMGTTHRCGAVAAACGLAFATQMPLPELAVVAGTGIVGSLFPDIDHKNSTISRKLPAVSWLARLFSTHRGLFHSPELYLLLWLLLIPVMKVYAGIVEWAIMGMFLGIANHLVLDACTKDGIPLLFPFSKKCFHILSIRTNSVGEKIVALLLVATAVFFTVCRVYS